MSDPAITAFFDERKASWLKKNLKASMSEVEVREKEMECEAVFSLEQWLPNAANRAKSRAMSTHPSKFSHPSTGVGKDNRKNTTFVTPIISKSNFGCDGFLRSGNAEVVIDSIGNAGELDVDEFLNIPMIDGKSILSHLEMNSVYIQGIFSIETSDYQSIRSGLLAMIKSDGAVETSSKVKQVYFPVVDGYHLLSLLTPSGLIFELKKRCRLSDDEKIVRDKKKAGEFHAVGFRQIVDITVIGYGGANPWNISLLNKNNYGQSYLLLSAPPELKSRDIHFPQSDFFGQTVNYYQCKHQFYQLHKLYSRDENNMHIRAEREEYYQSVIDHIIEKMWQVRSVAIEQYNPTLNQLSSAQKTWLCEQEEIKVLRNTTDDWLDDVVKSITTFVFHGYEKILGKKAIKFGDAEHKHMQKLVLANREALR